jgi:hypothetical protein
VTIKRCLPVLNSPERGVIRSGSGLIVTEVNSGAETTPAEFVAVMVSWITVFVTWVGGNVGAVKVRLAVVGPVGVMARLTRAGAPVCVTVQASGVSAGTLGSEPLTGKFPGAPENTVIGATWLTTGAKAAFTVTCVLAVLLPQLFVAVSDSGTTVCARTTGAV